MKKGLFVYTTFALFTCLNIVHAQEDEAKFLNAIWQEAAVPEYALPGVLTSFDGQPITSVAEWESLRRPEIMQAFAENLYGKVPEAAAPIRQQFDVVEEDSIFLEGLCTRRVVRITVENEYGKVELPMLLFIPNSTNGPSPAIYWLSLTDIERNRFDMEGPQRFGETKNKAPLKQLMIRGIALISIDAAAFGDRAQSQARALSGGIIPLHTPGKSPQKDEWGLISIWAYAMRCGMNYIETDSDIHAEQVAAMGSSIGGKVALWAAAQDERIGMVLSSTSGHGGDALWRRQYGETLANMSEWLPRWLCRNASRYAKNVNQLPVDQHMLLAAIAPRPLYVSTAVHDRWADPKGQWLSIWHASPVYRLYQAALPFHSEVQPSINQPFVESAVGYHLRSGFHGLQLYDWERFMEFIEYHFMEISPRSVQEVYYPDGQLINHYPNRNPK